MRKLIDLCLMAVNVDPTLEREQQELIAAHADSWDVEDASNAFLNF